MDYPVVNNSSNHRFEIKLEDGEYAFLEYHFYEGKLALMHTLVPKAHEGKGYAAALAKAALDYARENNYAVKVYCPYVAAYLKRHPEYNDLVDYNHHHH